MRNFFKIFGIIAIAAVIVLSTTGCENDPSGVTPQTVTYTGIADNTTYTLKITENFSRAAYTPKAGDSYELTAGTKKSTGTVNSYNFGEFTLQPANSDQTFKATISGNYMTEITGTIKWTDNTTETAPKIKITPLTMSGTFSGTLNGSAFNEVEIYPFMFFNGRYDFVNERNNDQNKTIKLDSPSDNATWSIGEIPFTRTPTDVLIQAIFKINNIYYSKYFFYDVGNNYNESTRTLSGINIDVGDVKLITLSGTISSLPSNSGTDKWEIWAHIKNPNNPYSSAGSDMSQITNGNWSITLLSFKEETDIYFELRGYKGDQWSGYFSKTSQKVSNVDKSNISLSYTTDFGNN